MTGKQCLKIIMIADHYGIISQLGILAEECVELAKEALKIVRQQNADKAVNKKPITGEIADVLIMMGQIQFLLDIDPNEVSKMVDYKLNRQLRRMRRELNEAQKDSNSEKLAV